MVKTLSSQTLKKNNNPPTFSLKGTDDKLYSLEDFKSKCLLIVFICNHCPYVKARIGDLVALQTKFSESELQIVGINSNDPSYQDEGFDNMVKFSKEHNLRYFRTWSKPRLESPRKLEHLPCDQQYHPHHLDHDDIRQHHCNNGSDTSALLIFCGECHD